jgi:Cu-Zn family superoxide dismutase
MRRTIVALAAVTAALVGAIVVSAGSVDRRGSATPSASSTRGEARAALVNAAGATVGTVAFDLRRGITEVIVRASGLSPGFHGFHVHTVGACDASSGFTSAGGHWNPTASSHAAHAGDMPSLLVNADGTAEASFFTARFTPEELLDADGSAVIVHAGPDNFANIPSRYAPAGPDSTTLATGDSGARTACGVVRGR